MLKSQPTITPAPGTSPTGPFEPPELTLDEKILAGHVGLDILPKNLTALVTASFLIAMDARDRRLQRQFFEDVLVMTFNFQNRLVRIAELTDVIRNIGAGKDMLAEAKKDLVSHITSAKNYQHNLLQILRMFGEMRGEEDPVS